MMRLTTIGLAASGLLAAGAFAVGGVHHVSANNGPCGSTGAYLGSKDDPGDGQLAAAGLCLDLSAQGNPGGFNGGTVEVGVGGTGTSHVGPLQHTLVPGTYAIVQGSSANADASGGQDNGYVGVSDFDGTSGTAGTGPQDIPCSGQSAGSGPNSGGSVGVDPLCSISTGNSTVDNLIHAGLPLPIACGHLSGNNWANTGRDGCWEP